MAAPNPSVEQIASWLREARSRTTEIIADLSSDQLSVPQLEILNPFIWEIGHVAWFQEKWVLRHGAGRQPLLSNGDELYDSVAVHHANRWSLPLPSLDQTRQYLNRVCEGAIGLLGGNASKEHLYLQLLALFHEDMHGEAFLYTRQTLSYPAPRLGGSVTSAVETGGPLPGDVRVPGGSFTLGAQPEREFVFDNECREHTVAIRPFHIARAAVTQAEFARFVDDGGYRRRELWSDDGWAWRENAQAEHPVYFRKQAASDWERRHFDRWVGLEPHRPVIHVNWYEANAYCRWAERRLPSEAEWEAVAAAEPSPDGRFLGTHKRRFPWGDEPSSNARANFDAAAMDTVDVGACPEGDSAFGCRQMLGNTWEWTATTFAPYPGFEPGPYKEYSEPWFGTRKVLRGGTWTTRSRMIRNTYRNFYTPDRRDVFAGFRTCRADP